MAWLLYAPALTADFVWDARAKVLGSDFIHEPANLGEVLTGRVLGRDVLDNNRPGNLLSLMVDAALWGRRPAGYHATSITLHAAVCAMLFLLLARLLPGQGTWAAFLGAAAFAVHPLNCEAVSEVSYREDMLVTGSMLAALFAAMAFMRKPGVWRNFALGAFCCTALLFGVSAKENGAAGPVILAGYWLLWRRGERRGPWVGLVAAGFVVVGGFLAARFALAPEHSIIFTSKAARLGGSLAGTLRIQPQIWAMQFTQIVFPHDLCADYSPYSLRNFTLGMATGILAAVICGHLFLALRDRGFALGAIVFWAGLLPVANLVPLYRPMADRFLYLPLVGLAMMLARGLDAADRLRSEARVTVYCGVAAWICAMGLMTFEREPVWHDSLALWQNTATVNPYSTPAADNLGWALFDAGRNLDACAAFRRAIYLTGEKGADPWAGLALASDAAGAPEAADAAYGRAAALDARYAHPQELVAALVMERDDAGKLEVLARRNTTP